MKLLFLSPILPYPIIDGDRQRAHHLLKALAEKHEVHFICFVRSQDESAHLKEMNKICATAQSVLITRKQLLLNCLRAWFGSRPLNVAAFSSKRMQALVNKTVSEHQIEGVHAYRLRMAPYALQAKVGFRVLDYTDAMTRQFQTRAQVQTGMARQVYLQHEIQRLKKYEVLVSHQFQATLISSARDRQLLVELGANPAMTEVTNGVDIKAITAVKKLSKDSCLLFLGNLEYAPNAWGLRDFCEHTWPRIKERLPQATLQVIGKVSDTVKDDPIMQQTGIQYLGVVAKLNTYFNQTRVAICPLQVASGRQFKVIEYFAAGLPTVCTSIVAEKLEAQAGKHCLVGDDPETFAQQVTVLCQDDSKSEKMRKAARTLAEQKYAWSNAADKMQTLYSSNKKTDKQRKHA
jgi:glycosyltransferase involved in cell wall biosynthesis